jgi:predicted ATPase
MGPLSRRGLVLPPAAERGGASSSSPSLEGRGVTPRSSKRDSLSEGSTSARNSRRSISGSTPRPRSGEFGAVLSATPRALRATEARSSLAARTMPSSSREFVSARIAQEMSAVLDADDDWDRHQKIQRALHRHNFTLHKLQLTGMELFGRDGELDVLREAFQQVAAATAIDDHDESTNDPLLMPKVAVVNVIGRAGTGKTRLCDELENEVAKRSGFFLKGKFDLQDRKEPFTGLVAALSSLVDQLKDRGDAVAGAVVSELLEAIGDDVRVLTSVVPALEALLHTVDVPSAPPGDAGDCAEGRHRTGSRPGGSTEDETTPRRTDADVVDAGVDEGRLVSRSSRLHYLFRMFFRCFCRPDHPVVLMLDDMQWSDDATRNVLSSVVTDPSLSSLLVLATCREEEVDDQHPWNVLLSDWQRSHASKVAVRHVSLSSLDRSAVLSIVQAALRCSDDERTVSLAEIVHSKSSGNALYALRFLSSLYDDGLLRYNVGSMSWAWDESAVRSRFVTENVVDLTTDKFHKLPPQLQKLLMMAACLGRTFDRTQLELIMRQDKVAALLGSCAAPSSSAASPVASKATTRNVVTEATEASKACHAPDVVQTTSRSRAIDESPISTASSAPFESSGNFDDKEEKEDASNTIGDQLQALLDQLVEDSIIECTSQLDTYCFAHDMIQEAAFCLIPEEIRGPVQREVGLALLRSHTIKELEENLFFRAIELSNVAPDDGSGGSASGSSVGLENLMLVRHNDDAGRRAMTKGAFGCALRYFEAGLQRLGLGSGEMKLFLELSSGAVEASFCLGNSEAMERHIAAVLKVDTPIENKVMKLRAIM